MPALSAIALIVAGEHPDADAIGRFWWVTAAIAWTVAALLLVSRLLPLTKEPPTGGSVPSWAAAPPGPRGPGQ